MLGSVVNAQDVLQPLVVTGQREVESDGNVDLEEIDAERVGELLGYLPGFAAVASDSAGFGDTLAVRGTANTLFFGGAGVAMVVDDVPYGDVYTYSTEFFDLESFTLHRGPQGSRFARNGAGGLIEMTTLGTTDTAEYGFSAEYGSYESLNLRFRASGPINDRWSYTFQSYYKKRDGYIENTNPAVGGNNDDREQMGALGSLYYNPSADLEVRFRAMYEATRDGSQRLTSLNSPDPFEVQSDLPGETEVDRFQLSLHVDQDLGWANFKSISSYQNWQLGPSIVDLDLSPFSGADSDIDQEQKLWSQEFRLESDDSESLRWTAGLAYLRKDTDGVADRFFFLPGNPMFGIPAGTFFSDQSTIFASEEQSVALFGNVQWDASDRVTFEVGGRLEYVESSLERSKVESGNAGAFGFQSYQPILSEADGWYFSPTLGINFELDDETSLFARTSTSFKPEGFTAFSDNPATTSYDEELAWETEVGLRYENSAQTLGFELRGYYKRIDDYQLNSSVQPTDFIILNAGRVDSYGVEGELVWRPSDALTVQVAAGWNQVEFNDYTDLSGNDFSGNNVPFIPQFTAGLTARYDFECGFYAQTGVRAVGSTYFDGSNNSNFKQKAYEVWDAQIGYQAENWNAAIFARNVFDEEYYSFMNNQIAAGAPGDPQVVGVRLGLEF